ncbi:MAG TPA: choice-of-anchor V domain-containing protein [Candidatus Margulisiibacteriota bacterium]|nr:choice-of-anchor V domain-containing protein [Candidatus Margulisiibacteriota bacterium]
MRNVDWSLPIVLCITVLAMATQAQAFSTGISSLSFGSSGCNACHGGGLAPTVTLTGPATVAAGSTNVYTLQISVVGAQNKGGLNVAATDGTLAVGGSAAAGTQTITGKNGLKEITHSGAKTASGGFVTFSFQWTAPSVGGSVTFTGWGNAVNGNFNPSGDMAAMATLVVTVTGGSNTPTSTPTPVCEPTPLPDCRKPVASGKSTFVVKDNVLDSKDTLSWNWTKGAETLLTAFGDPVTGSTSYHLCVYDESAGAPAAVMAMTAPSGGTCAGKPCWTAKKTGFLYKDKGLTNDGLMQLQLTAGAAGKAKIVVTGKGERLPLPQPVGGRLFAQDTAVSVQLVNSDGMCWEADFSAPAKKNDLKQFNDKSD